MDDIFPSSFVDGNHTDYHDYYRYHDYYHCHEHGHRTTNIYITTTDPQWTSKNSVSKSAVVRRNARN